MRRIRVIRAVKTDVECLHAANVNDAQAQYRQILDNFKSLVTGAHAQSVMPDTTWATVVQSADFFGKSLSETKVCQAQLLILFNERPALVAKRLSFLYGWSQLIFEG